MEKKLMQCSFLHSLGVLAYVVLVALIMTYGDRIFGNMKNVWGPIAFLLLFVLSALIVGILVLGKPIILYLDGKKKEGVKLLLLEVLWLLIITLLVLAALAIF